MSVAFTTTESGSYGGGGCSSIIGKQGLPHADPISILDHPSESYVYRKISKSAAVLAAPAPLRVKSSLQHGYNEVLNVVHSRRQVSKC